MKLPSPVEAEPPRSARKSMRRNATRIVSVGGGGGAAPSVANRRTPPVVGSRQPGRRDAERPAPTRAARRWSSASSGRNCFWRAIRASSVARSAGVIASARGVRPARCARRIASGGATGCTSSAGPGLESDPAARAEGAGAAGRIRKRARRVAQRRWRFTRASEAIAQGDLGDIRETGVLGLRDAAEVERQPLPPEAQSVRHALELAERVMVIPHTPRDLVRISDLDATVQLPERVGHERLVEVAGREHLEAFLLPRLPREAGLDVP